MKRSEINRAIKKARGALEEISFFLPSFGSWTLAEWYAHKYQMRTILEVMQGWCVTDFGRGDFYHTGMVAFTLRGGNPQNRKAGVPYCERVIVFDGRERQTIPLHFHRRKTADIINRGNGIIEVELFNSRRDGSVDLESEVVVHMDGILRVFEPGEVIEITPGNSISLTPGLYHRISGKKGEGDVVVGEVSLIHDEKMDLIWNKEQDFSLPVEEDEPILYPLVSDYRLF